MSAWLRARSDPQQRYGLRVTLFAMAFMLVGVPFGLLVDQVMREGALLAVDTSAANNLHSWVRESPLLVDVLRVVTTLGDPIWFYAIGAAGFVVLVRSGRRRRAMFFVVTTLSGGLINSVVKVVVDRDRPSLIDPVATAYGQSFPSGHSMSSVVVYGALLLVFLPSIPRRFRTAAAALAAVLCLAIGFSRLALGVHYITDVLGGFVLGLAWLMLSVAAFGIWGEDRAEEARTDTPVPGSTPPGDVRPGAPR